MCKYKTIVTYLDKTKLYAILDTGFIPYEKLAEVCSSLIQGGADIIQLRAKNETLETCSELIHNLLPIFEATDVPLIVNDHIKAALQFEHVGVHLGQEDMHPKKARELLGSKRLLGYSTHSIEQAQEAIEMAGILDYFAVGPVYSTPTKPEYVNTQVGLELVQAVAAMNSPIPFFCIGGIHRKCIAELRAAGGTRAVAISDLLTAKNITAATREMKTLLEA